MTSFLDGTPHAVKDFPSRIRGFPPLVIFALIGIFRRPEYTGFEDITLYCMRVDIPIG
jgi:hypothetical protein